MHLSRLAPNLISPDVLRDLADLQQVHRRVMEGFNDAEGPGRLAHGVLWRWDADPGRTPVIYVQSATPPDWSQLPAGYLAEQARTRDLSEIRNMLHAGRRFSFRLVASATRSIPSERISETERPRGKRVPIGDPEGQLQWLNQQGERYGFHIEKSGSGAADIRVNTLPRGSGRRVKGQVTVTPVRFEGRLAITDPDAFWEGFTTGIGRAKAYGCGLLTLARP